ncbi:uncharacterized protein LOC123266847 [Cotesia glomerata]|uniref:uncharacterized protein LOC123266847 n=1 Tax=Cotesia glomerata TaxID=32391 RepID=UPI001D0124AD|nr:uncharacterized protein LOC123266847 [Cotesia glomerata]
MKYDASNLPPCKAELHQHLLRTQYITSIWRNAHLCTPTYLFPGTHGWTLQDDAYEFKWFEGDCMPQTVLDAIRTGSSTEKDSVNEADERDCYDEDMFSSDDSTEEESDNSSDEDEN